jgi:hypothetical protein
MKPIKLGTEIEPLGVKDSPAEESAESADDQEKEMMYPNVFLEFDKDTDPELPKSGTITFKYRLAGMRERYKDGRCSYDLDLVSISDVGGCKDCTDKSAEDAMAEYADEKDDDSKE